MYATSRVSESGFLKYFKLRHFRGPENVLCRLLWHALMLSYICSKAGKIGVLMLLFAASFQGHSVNCPYVSSNFYVPQFRKE